MNVCLLAGQKMNEHHFFLFPIFVFQLFFRTKEGKCKKRIDLKWFPWKQQLLNILRYTRSRCLIPTVTESTRLIRLSLALSRSRSVSLALSLRLPPSPWIPASLSNRRPDVSTTCKKGSTHSHRGEVWIQWIIGFLFVGSGFMVQSLFSIVLHDIVM